jgi:hypothetical protein
MNITCRSTSLLMNGGDGDKIVYVVFKYISRSQLQKRVGAGGVTPLTPPFLPVDPGIFHLKTT